MESESKVFFKSKNPIFILALIIVGLISVLFIFKNILFESSLALKSYGKISMDPEIAFNNTKPTFLEFYAEWCEVCKEMAPKIIESKNKYQNDINFVFLDVDNPKWEKYIKQFNVNGIPQMVFLDNNFKTRASLIGFKDEILINNALDKLLDSKQELDIIPVSKFSKIQNHPKDTIKPRSHS
ncbi:MAG: thioredoxin [Prochlorococcus sp. SP3034]|nr:thioredoxin [Prochlorococcus sp. SP3034]|tara:strand:- start:2804 stop:3349 length:546 start_codon:yes stop_codon:yes gene_type:complete